MAKNQVFKYVDTLSVPVPEGTQSGDPVVLNADIGLVGVAETDRGPAEGAEVTADTKYADGNVNGYASVGLKGAYSLPDPGALEPLQPAHSAGAGSLTARART